MTHGSDFPFIDLDSPPEGWLVPDAVPVEDDTDLWVGMACNVAIEGHTELPSGPDGLRETAKTGRANDPKALAGCATAWESLDADAAITENALQRLNRLVREGEKPDVGAWRTGSVYVTRTSRRVFPTGNSLHPFEYEDVTEVVYEAPPGPLVPEMMEKYLQVVEQWGDHPLAPWWAHLMLVLIHPWGDGNGRTARLVEAHLFRRQGIPAPWASTRNNWPHRPVYYQALNETRHRNDPGEFYLHQIRMREHPAPIMFEKKPGFITGKARTRPGPPLSTGVPAPDPKITERDREALELLAFAQALPPNERKHAMIRYWSASIEK